MAPTHNAAQHTLAEALAESLTCYASHAFGLMGNGNAHVIDALTAQGVQYTAVRHEAATVAAADAYTRITGNIAIATATYGAGFTNALTALAEAAQARTPMLVVVGDAPTTGPRAWDVDQEMLAAALGVRTHTLQAAHPAEIVARATASALRNQRPVVIALPYDLVNYTVKRAERALAPTEAAAATTTHADTTDSTAARVTIDLSDPSVIASLIQATKNSSLTPDELPKRTPATTSAAHLSKAALSKAVHALQQSQRPVVIAGRGATLSTGAAAQLDILARSIGALTSTTALARGFFSDSYYDLGVTGGFGQEAAMEVLSKADTVVVVGASLNQFTMRFGELFSADTVVIRIDGDEVKAPRTAHPITHHLLQGDAATVLQQLNQALSISHPQQTGWRTEIAGLEPGGALRVRAGSLDPAESVLADGLLDPRSVALRLAQSLPTDRYVTSDGGHFIGWANMYWPVTAPERMIMVGTAYQTIGLGFSTVAGVAAAAPDSTVVLTTGDGGGLMSLADLETTIRTARSCVVVVWNDAAYGAEVHLYGRMGLNETPMLIPEANFAGLATALGATGVAVRSLADLDQLDEWRANGALGTIVLDCRISPSIVAPYQEEVLKANGVK